MSETLALFRLLTSVPTAPFYESAVSDKTLGWIRRRLGGRVQEIGRAHV